MAEQKILWAITQEFVEAALGRKLEPGEASSFQKTLEWGLAEETHGLIIEHFGGGDEK